MLADWRHHWWLFSLAMTLLPQTLMMLEKHHPRNSLEIPPGFLGKL